MSSESMTVPKLPHAKRIAERFSRLVTSAESQSVHQPPRSLPDAHGTSEAELDRLAAIAVLAHEEIELIRGILDTRFSGGHVAAEQIEALRQVHRRGFAARQHCGDPVLESELGWLQGYGSFAIMADLSEFDRAHFEQDLAFRGQQIERAIAIRRAQLITTR